uniref:Uncharacterized protein n=1 Tax=Cacopsylla melanoneura TaxID=428564 RepID=A0A8D9ALA9_9HEMI
MTNRFQMKLFIIVVCIHLNFHVTHCKKKGNKGMMIHDPEVTHAIVYEPEGKKLPEVLDPYMLVNDPTAMDLFTDGFELPENKPSQLIKKILRKEDDRFFKREMRVRFLGKSRHPNTENNWRTKRTEPDWTSVETQPDHAYLDQKYAHLFIE